ncbi:MAG: helix-turn-helix domain-containing protein [Oscillospiraceae bacterium]|jgi:AraC-like DNA-binding protein|nr:helix-turn-helix domain-containing protein [Oscillospiraceae bacterium]MCI1990429.1 helix-turn-helix domain-containing protein [Oscillospiraceae bacterium]
MKIEGLHEKEIFDKKFPFRLIVNRNLNFQYPPHWHNAIELIYVLKNDFVVLVNSRKYDLREKDILYIPGGDIHEFCSETPTGTRIFINFELSSLNSYADMDRIYTQLRAVRPITPKDGTLYPKIEAELQKVLKERENGGFTEELYYTARMIDILVLLCQSTPLQVNIDNLKNRKSKSVGLEKIGKSFEFIEKNYMEDIHLKDIARAAGFSEYYFSRLFKEVTEKNFHQYLNEYRIKKAEILLTNPNYTISETAYAVGFSSISTFDRLFHQNKGCSPQDFRKLYVGV